MAWGQGGYSRVLCLQTVLSFRPMEEAAQLCCSISCLGMLRGEVAVVTVALGVCRVITLGEPNQGEGACVGLTCGAVLFSISPHLVLVSSQAQVWMAVNAMLGGIKPLRDHGRTKTIQRQVCS